VTGGVLVAESVDGFKEVYSGDCWFARRWDLEKLGEGARDDGPCGAGEEV